MVFLLNDFFSIRRRWWDAVVNVHIPDDLLNRFLDEYDVLLVDAVGESIFDYSHKMSHEQIDMIFSKHMKTIYDENGEVIRINTRCNPYMLQKLLERDVLGDYVFQKNYHLSLGEKVNGYEKVTLLDYLKDKLTFGVHPFMHPQTLPSHPDSNIMILITMLEKHYCEKMSLYNLMLHKFEVELGLNPSKKRRRF